MSPPAITFAIPFYANLGFLRRALASLQAQDDPAWRAVVCDDHGEEGAADVVAALGDGRISYVSNERRLGLAGNWNRCLDASDTELTTILHADDELLPGYASLMTNAATRWPAAAAFFCQARIIDAAGAPARSVPDLVKRVITRSHRGAFEVAGEEGAAALLRANFIMCPTLCYRRARLGARRFDPRWAFVTDLELTVRLVESGETLVGLPDTAFAYRRHADSETAKQTVDLRRFEEERAFLLDKADALARRGWSRAAADARRARMLKLNVGFCALEDLARGRWAAAKAKAGLLATMSKPARG